MFATAGKVYRLQRGHVSIRGLKALVQKEGQQPLLFVVYPGSSEYAKILAPLWVQRLISQFAPCSLYWVGRIVSSEPGMPYGLVATLSDHPENLSREEFGKFIASVYSKAEILGARGVALAGVLPGLAVRYEISLESPIVLGLKVTICAVTETLADVCTQEELGLDTPIAVLGGMGHIGWKVVPRLVELGYTNVAGVDPAFTRTRKRAGATLTNEFEYLRDRRVVIVLTDRGSAIATVEKYVPEDVLLVNDAYPPIPEGLAGRRPIREVGLVAPGFSIDPALPGIPAHVLVGCLGEAYLLVRGIDVRNMTQDEVDDAARTAGLRSRYHVG